MNIESPSQINSLDTLHQYQTTLQSRLRKSEKKIKKKYSRVTDSLSPQSLFENLPGGDNGVKGALLPLLMEAAPMILSGSLIQKIRNLPRKTFLLGIVGVAAATGAFFWFRNKYARAAHSNFEYDEDLYDHTAYNDNSVIF